MLPFGVDECDGGYVNEPLTRDDSISLGRLLTAAEESEFARSQGCGFGGCCFRDCNGHRIELRHIIGAIQNDRT
jgi:hypothetical protein